MTVHVITGMDSSEGAVESVTVEHCALGVVHLTVEKDGESLGIYVELDDLIAALRDGAA